MSGMPGVLHPPGEDSNVPDLIGYGMAHDVQNRRVGATEYRIRVDVRRTREIMGVVSALALSAALRGPWRCQLQLSRQSCHAVGQHLTPRKDAM